MIDAALDSKNPWLEGIDRERLERESHVRLNFESGKDAGEGTGATQPFLPFAYGNFRTPSGRAEFYSDSLKAQGLDPVAEFTPPAESRHGKRREGFPLELLARKSDNFLNSTFSNLSSIQEMEEPGLLEMHAADAQSRGIAEGDPVRVFNGRGEITVKARGEGAVKPGGASPHPIGAKLTPDSG